MNFFLVFIVLFHSIYLFAQKASAYDGTYKINAGGLTVSISANGEITSLNIHGKKYEKPVFAYTTIAGCRQEGATVIKNTDGKTIVFERRLVHDSLQKSCVLTDRFIPTATGVRWELTVKGSGEAWGSKIQTRIRYPAEKNTLFWTTWGAPQYDSEKIDISTANRLRKHPTGTAGRAGSDDEFYTWIDPLIPLPFTNVDFDYGTQHYKYGQVWFYPKRHTFCIPLATVMEPDQDTGLTFALSPEDNIINLIMRTSAQGEIVFDRLFNRISSDRDSHYSMDITAHAADWRPALAWMTHRYPEYFNPVNPQAHILGGTGAYSGHLTNNFDVEKMKKMCFTVNWQASFDFPYMGMFLPPVGKNEEWDSFKGEKTSMKAMNDYAADMKRKGFYVLNYFNVSEFGDYILYPPLKDTTLKKDRNLWKQSNEYLKDKFPNAILARPDSCVSRLEYKGAVPGEPWFSWYNCVVMDCGEESYRKFLLEQAQRHVDELPDAYGINIDQMSQLVWFNERADDGVSWFDVLKHLDGIFCEFSHGRWGVHLNLMAFLCVNKPSLSWVDAASTVKQGGDAFFQKYLYMGAFPMCPFPENDHGIRPDPEAERLYLDYGPLMRLMQSRQWVLEPHAVAVENNHAKVNMFQTPEGYSIPVVYGETGKVRIKIANIEGLNKQTVCTAYYPGKETPVELTLSKSGKVWYVDVPLERGCAMLKLTTKR